MPSREIKRLRDRMYGNKEPKEKKKASPLTIPAIIVIGLVLVGLVWWGRSANVLSSANITFGYYDGRPIIWSSGNYFARKVAEVLEHPQLKNNPDVKNKDEFAIRYLMPYMIFHTAALIEAEKSGLSVTDKEVEDYIIKIGAKERYNKADAVERHDLFNIFKEELIELKLIETMIQTFDNKSLETFAAGMGLSEKKFRFVEWKYDEFPTQETIKFASENPDLFRRIKLTRIAAKKESDAKDIYEKITGNQSTFEEQLAALSKSDSEEAGKLDWQSFYSLVSVIGNKDAVDKIFSLKQGEISNVVHVGSDWVIYRCDQEPVAADLSSPKTIKEIKGYILDVEKGKAEGYFEAEAKAFLARAGNSSLPATAAGSQRELFETDFFPINFNSLSFLKKIPEISGGNTSLEDAQSQSVFFKEAFALKKGALSQPILLSDKVIIIELIGERSASKDNLEKIKTDFKAFRDHYFKYFEAIIANRIYTRGLPQYYYGQMMYSLYDLQLDQQQFYIAFIDPEKLGARAEQDEQLAKGFEAYHQPRKK